MNPEGMEGGVEKQPDEELLTQELEVINNELIANNADGTLSDEALAAKETRKREIEEVIANNQN
jgi:hypothetical protein